MKYIFTLLFGTLSLLSSAQVKPFYVKINVVGSDDIKYVYAFDNNYKLISKEAVRNSSSVLTGNYKSIHRFGEPAFLNIYFSKEDLSEEVISSKNLLSKAKYGVCTVLANDTIDVTYNLKGKSFKIIGGSQNEIQNQFLDILARFRISRDSSYHEINSSQLDSSQLDDMKMQQARKLSLVYYHQVIDLIHNNPNSEVSLFNIDPVVYATNISANETTKTFQSLSKSIQESEYGKHVFKDVAEKARIEEIAKNPAFKLGDKFPDYELSDNNGKKISIHSNLGNYTLIDFWATWCIPCRKETPNMIHNYMKYNLKGLKIITVSTDKITDKENWIKVLKDDKMVQFVNLFGGTSGIAIDLKITALPTNYLVDRDGKIIGINLRGKDLTDTIDKLFK
ncbi:thiol-disulfide isomerase/thioredoxin [Pedobacter sp. UYP24]